MCTHDILYYRIHYDSHLFHHISNDLGCIFHRSETFSLDNPGLPYADIQFHPTRQCTQKNHYISNVMERNVESHKRTGLHYRSWHLKERKIQIECILTTNSTPRIRYLPYHQNYKAIWMSEYMNFQS